MTLAGGIFDVALLLAVVRLVCYEGLIPQGIPRDPKVGLEVGMRLHLRPVLVPTFGGWTTRTHVRYAYCFVGPTLPRCASLVSAFGRVIGGIGVSRPWCASYSFLAYGNLLVFARPTLVLLWRPSALEIGDVGRRDLRCGSSSCSGEACVL